MKKKTRRQVLGVGYPWFSRKDGSCGFVFTQLVTKVNVNESTDVVLKLGDLGAHKKIKLIAEYTE